MDYLMGNTDNPESQKNNPQDLVAAAEEIAAVINEFQMQTQDLIIKLNNPRPDKHSARKRLNPFLNNKSRCLQMQTAAFYNLTKYIIAC